MALTAKEIAATVSGDKPRKISDNTGTGLYLDVRPSGEKVWRQKARIAGRETALTIGRWPAVPVQAARIAAAANLAELKAGKDPRRPRIAAQTFRDVSVLYLEAKSPGWVPGHAKKIRERLERHIYPMIGVTKIATLKPMDVLAIVRKVAAAGTVNTAHRCAGLIGEVCRYAVAHGLMESDPTRDLRGVLPAVGQPKHRPALTEPDQLGAFWKTLLTTDKLATDSRDLLLAIGYTFQRAGEVRAMAWDQIDAASSLWRFTVSKVRLEHAVPLSTQMLALLERRRASPAGDGPYVFPGRLRGTLSATVPTLAIRQLGFDTGAVTAHGFRASARTLLSERLEVDPRYIELQLSHSVPEVHGRAYNRALYIKQRAEMMQQWADYLDKLTAEVSA